MTVKEILNKLNNLADPEKVTYKEKKFGVVSINSLGIYMKDLNELAKEIPKEPHLAIELFNTNLYEARVLCGKLFKPKFLTEELADKWVKTFENWEICDTFSMGIFAKSNLAVPKIFEWANREAEFERRAAFATMAAYCMANKKASNEEYKQFYPLLIKYATDERNFVKKAVNWALRSIGKRNIDLQSWALNVSNELIKTESKSAQWIAKDALKELSKSDVRMSDYPRDIYRPK